MSNKPIIVPRKPIEPKEPQYKDYRDLPDGQFVLDYTKYLKDLTQYREDVKVYEQVKLIKFIKAADIKLILKKYYIKKKVV